MKRPILYCVIPFCAGISLAYFFGISIVYSIVLSAAFVTLALLTSNKNTLSHIFLYLSLIFFGAAYYQNYNILPDNHIKNFLKEEGARVMIRGRVADDPAAKKAFYGKEKISFLTKAEYIKIVPGDRDWVKTTGLVKTDLYSDERSDDLSFGDELIMEGMISGPEGLKNPGLFDYSKYLSLKNVYAVFTVNGIDSARIIKSSDYDMIRYAWDWVQKNAYRLRHKIIEMITKYVEKPYSGFLNAILIGERAELDSSITDDFIKTGTVHVIAISGLNITLVAGIFLAIFKFLGIRKRSNLALTSLAIVFYCFMAGSSPPVVRATVVFVIASFGFYLNRESDILNSLSLAAFLILLVNPKELFDPSFQLSFGSVISIILFVPKIEGLFGKKTNYIIKSAAVSIAASIGVFPIVARYFNIVSPIAVLANLAIVPALFVLTVASFVFLSFNFIGAVFCLGWMGMILSMLTRVTFYINHLFARIPLSHIRIPAPSPFFICAYYAFLAYIFFAKNRKHILIAALFAVNIFVWSQAISYKSGQLKITFLDVGRGDSAVVRFPDSGAMLVDGGSGGVNGTADTGKSVVAPYLWNNGIRKLDAVVVTHFHEDHLGGLFYILENFKIGCVIDNGEPSAADMALYEKYTGIIRRKRIRRIIVNDGDEITGFGDTKIFVFNPVKAVRNIDPNDDSLVLKINYNNFSALFCGDISSEAMGRIIAYGDLLKSDIVKMPHHGGDVGSVIMAKRFFDLISPQVFITSSGGKYGSSKISKKTRELIGSLDSADYETRRQGAISVISDGTRFKVTPFCQKN